MKRMKQILFALVIATIPSAGQAFRSTNGFSVESVGGAAFEVSDWQDMRADAVWCAAANYARRVQKTEWKTDLYVVRSIAPSTTTNNGFSVRFSADPAALGVSHTGPGSSMGQFLVGDRMSIQQANSLCAPVCLIP